MSSGKNLNVGKMSKSYRYERMRSYIREQAKTSQEANLLWLAVWNDEYADYAIRPYSNPWHYKTIRGKLLKIWNNLWIVRLTRCASLVSK